MYITIIADSKRHEMLATSLKRDGHAVTVYKEYDSLPTEISSEIIILPIPSFTASGILNLKGAPDTLNKEAFFQRFSPDSFIITCNCEAEGRRFLDINKYEPFVFSNAVPSAEGAIALAMQNSDITLYKSRSLVIGYGRIGKLIASRLKGFCGSVSVVARKEKDRLVASSKGYESLDFPDIDVKIDEFDFIFQTVPFLTLTRDRIDKITGLIVEISSKGLGTDMEYAKEKGVRLIYAPGIPEKYSSKTAGNILSDSVKSIISEL